MVALPIHFTGTWASPATTHCSPCRSAQQLRDQWN